MQKIKITKKNSGQRLDKFLAQELNTSRNQIQKMVKSGQILVNTKIARTAYKLCEKDVIEMVKKEIKKPTKKEAKIKAKKINLKLKIVFENNDFLVIEKPAGISVHPSETSQEKTLIDFVLEKYPKIAKVGEDPQRPGIVHRLDKNVSGLIVIAKNQDAFDHLKDQFKKRQVKKEYTALVYGKIEKNEGEIDFHISRSKDGKMAASPKSQELKKSKRAITEYEVIKGYQNYTLVKAMPKTGRMHQIRVHFYAFNHPIVGDELYAQKKYKVKIKLKRLFLHSSHLEFFDMENTLVKFDSPLPLALKNILKKLT